MIEENKNEEMNEKTNEETIENVEVNEVKEQDSTQKELDEITDRYKRVLAEFENFKKRSMKEREALYKTVLSDIVEKLLPIVDNLENALKVETKDEEYKKGIELVLKQFQDMLKAQGVEEIESVGTTFNPEYHEAVSSIQDDKKGEQEIVQEYRKGYKIGNKVVRHSMVIVAN